MPALIEEIMPLVVTVVLMAATAGRIDELQAWIWKVQTKLIQDSRASTWGSSRFFSDRRF